MRNAGFESEILDETGDKVDHFAVLRQDRLTRVPLLVFQFASRCGRWKRCGTPRGTAAAAGMATAAHRAPVVE